MSDENVIRRLLSAGSARLEPVSDSPRLDAELLLARAIDMPRSFLYAHSDDELDELAAARFNTSIARRLDGEPLAYICGSKEFWSMTLQVSPATLVPRPETEVLVEQALNEIPRDAAFTIADLGTGSGAIALAIASERPACQVIATDSSADALDVARENARQLAVPNIEFLQGSWTEPLTGRRLQLIVSNPPYVADDDAALLALQHEPRSALASGSDGLDDLRHLVQACLDIIEPGGCLLLEHGNEQAEPLAELLVAAGWLDIVCSTDLAGLPRVTRARAPA